MRPINKQAALGLSHTKGQSAREPDAVVAFGRSTTHLPIVPAARRKTKHKYRRPHLTIEEQEALFHGLIEKVVFRRDDGSFYKGAMSQKRARTLLIGKLAEALGPHQAPIIERHPSFDAVFKRVVDHLDKLRTYKSI